MARVSLPQSRIELSLTHLKGFFFFCDSGPSIDLHAQETYAGVGRFAACFLNLSSADS